MLYAAYGRLTPFQPRIPRAEVSSWHLHQVSHAWLKEKERRGRSLLPSFMTKTAVFAV
jgi:hypothetical protein